MLKLNQIYCGDCLDVMKKIDDNSIDTIITDPPYGLSFMNKKWDYDVPSIKIWEECLRVLKPGGTALIFAGSRTQHRMAVNVEDTGFILKDCIMWVYGCLSEDTEILTINGWKNYKEIKQKDKVFSMDLKENKLVQNEINQIFKYNYIGKMISLKNQNTDQLLTLNHKVICKQGHRKQINYNRKINYEKQYSYKDAYSIKSDHYTLPLANKYNGNYSIGESFAEVIGWVLSEGNYQKGCNAVNIYQSSVNIEKVDRIRHCLNRAGIKYSEYKRNRKYKNREYTEYQWYISGEYASHIKKIIPNKKPTKKLWELKLSEKERLIKGLCEGDGSKNKIGHYNVFYQNDIKFLEWFQVLLHLTGKQGWINKNKMCCSIHYNDSTQIQGKHYKNRQIDYKGIVWCINTNMGNFIAKRNGKIFITGNSGFPKATDISKQLDKGHKRKIIGTGKSGSKETHKSSLNMSQVDNNTFGGEYDVTEPATPEAKLWNGWKSHGLKPAYEPILVAVKSNDGTYANNALKWGVSGLNIDGGRIKTEDKIQGSGKGFLSGKGFGQIGYGNKTNSDEKQYTQGRFPANIILDEEAAEMLDEQSGESKSTNNVRYNNKSKTSGKGIYGKFQDSISGEFNDSGGASRFFYIAKASKKERNIGYEKLNEKQVNDGRNKLPDNAYQRGKSFRKNTHPTVKPLKLMEYLCILTKTPTGGIVLDPFAGSGTTGIACKNIDRPFILIEKEPEYCEISCKRIGLEKYTPIFIRKARKDSV